MHFLEQYLKESESPGRSDAGTRTPMTGKNKCAKSGSYGYGFRTAKTRTGRPAPAAANRRSREATGGQAYLFADRYWLGVMPVEDLKALLKTDLELNPASYMIFRIVSSLCTSSKRRFASAIR